jgi:ABC-type Fe3+/spermidine/putrescine transport system ATPase subunit
MAWLEVDGLTKNYSDFRLELGFTAEEGEIVAILGPSGAGKSTLLRLLAGLIRPDSGRLLIGGRDVARLSPRQRGIGLVFQDFALFPHYTVAQNVEYGLKLRGMPAAARQARVEELLRRFTLPDFGPRRPGSLSGGEKQRVALARALAVEPRLMLFDEPLGSLDAALRKELRSELRLLQRELGYTSISVTHDQEDALAVSDRLLVVKDGRIVQSGSPEAVWQRPASAFVAAFFGDANLLPVLSGPDGLGRLETPWGPLRANLPDCTPVNGTPVLPESRLFIRTERVRTLAAGAATGGGENRLAARVADFEFLGRGYLARARPATGAAAAAEIRFWIDRRPAIGDALTLELPPGELLLLPPD